MALGERNEELEGKLTSSEKTVKELKQQLARKELQNSELMEKTKEMETTLSVYQTVPKPIVLSHWSIHFHKRQLDRLQQQLD